MLGNGGNHQGDVTTMVSGKVVVLAALVAVVVVASAVIVLANRDDTQATGTTSTSPTPPRLTSAKASQLAADMTSGDEKRVRAAVAVSPKQPLDEGAITGLAAIETMSFDVGTFRGMGDQTAEVTARVVMPGAEATVWTVRLVAVDPEWLISSTEPAQ